MKSGFLLDKKSSKGGRGALGDPRSTEMERYLNNEKNQCGTNENEKKDTTKGKEQRQQQDASPKNVSEPSGWSDFTASSYAGESSWGSTSTSATNNTRGGWGTESTSDTTPGESKLPKTDVGDIPNEDKSSKFQDAQWVPPTFDAPKLTLTNWYSKYFKGIMVTNNCYETRSNGFDGKEMAKRRFTSIFTCPVSGNKFKSGKQRFVHFSHHDIVTDDNGITTLWFHKKVEAEHAAAARTLDCLNYLLEQQKEERKVKMNGLEYRGYCYEEPEIPARPFPPPESTTQKTNNSAAEGNKKCGEMEVDENNAHSKPKQPVMQCMTDWLQNNYRIQFQKSNSFKYDNNNALKTHLLKWTATLTCPASGNTFTSGRLKESNGTFEVVEDIVWYSNKKEAEKAAAGKMMDCIAKFVDQDNSSSVYYCLDEPSTAPVYKYPPKRQKLLPPGAFVPLSPSSEQAKEAYVNTRGRGPTPMTVE